MKTLYITDLDGTLLNPSAELSAESKKFINSAIDKGAMFTIATARTFATVLEMFADVKLKLPVVLMNGVMIYDPCKNDVVKCHNIDYNTVSKVLEIYKKHCVSPLVYFFREKYLEILYTDTSNVYQMAYVNKRTAVEGKTFTYMPDNITVSNEDKVVYIVALDKYEKLAPLYAEIKNTGGVSAAFYEDNYTDCYFLEIFAENVSKASGLRTIKERIYADKVIAFGDNLNDIDMFSQADESYAVSNAYEEVKKRATAVIGSNNEDAVAKFIYNDITKSSKEKNI